MSRRVGIGPALALLAALALGCERVEPTMPAPAAEFVVVAGDSAFWIRSDAEGIRVRGAPMVLALVDGRFAELYVTDEDLSFYDAVYVGQRLYKRDIINGDSMVLVADTVMPLLARGYASANPDERPLAYDEQGSDAPRTMASAELVVLDVMGPWVSYEYRTDVDVVGGASSHGLRRGVVDLRTGVPTTLEALFGRREARSAVVEGQRQWRELRDSLRAAAPEDEALLDDLSRLSFDARSFTIGVEDRRAAVRFALAQSGASTMAAPQLLFPVPMGEPVWWPQLRGEYPETSAQGEARWPRGEYALVAQPRDDSPSPRMALLLRDAGGQEWRLGFVPAPVTRVMWLGDSLAPGTREALLRAFDEASLYSEDTRVAQAGRARAGRGPIVHPAAFVAPGKSPARRAPRLRPHH